MSWWRSRTHSIEPVRPHVSMPTVVTEFRALKPGTVPTPKPPVQRLDVQSQRAPVDFNQLPA